MTGCIPSGKLTVTGYIMLHGNHMNSVYNASSGLYDFDRSFEEVKELLIESDFTIGNLETTFSGGFSDYPLLSTSDVFGYTLKNAGFDFVSTANNHSADNLKSGIVSTIETLGQMGIDYA